MTPYRGYFLCPTGQCADSAPSPPGAGIRDLIDREVSDKWDVSPGD